MVKYPLTGGLDLATVKPLVSPGTLKDCLNFEVATVDGYTRIGGVERFDGSEDVGSYKVWRLRYEGEAVFAPGDEVAFPSGEEGPLTGVVLEIAEQGGQQVIYVLFPGSTPTPSLPDTLNGDTESASILSREVVFVGRGEQQVFNAGLKTITDAQRARIGQVPGRPGSDIIGGFFYKDRTYCIRDLPRIAFEGGYYTESDEGKHVTIDGLDYKILDVRITGSESGILTLDTESGSGAAASPIGPATLTELPVSGDLDDGYLGIPYTDGITPSGGVAPYTWSVVGDGGTAIEAIDPVDASAITFLPQTTNAALYRSSSSGWERVDLGREMPITGGTIAIDNFIRDAILSDGTVVNTGFVFPGSGELNGSPTANLGADDGTNAALGAGATNEIQATNYDMSTVPDNATIVGIEVVVERQSNTAAQASDLLVDLVGVSGGTSNKAVLTPWLNAGGTVTFGGPTDLWGSQSITAAVVRSSLFGARLLATRTDAGTPSVGWVDYIKIKVYYIEKDQPIYVWNGVSDIEMILRHTQLLGGATDTNTATGYMTVSASVNADKARMVQAGDQIRSGPAGAGDLLAVAGGPDRPIWLAGQAELDNNRARYMFEKTNFYGQDEFEAVYGVCGCSPAFTFDGTRCIRIRTQLPPTQDLPRHVARHGDMLVLGYFPGALVFSSPEEGPIEMRSELGATAVEVGDRLTNLAPMAGDALVVVCQSSTYIIRGLVPETFTKTPISARRGGIEYTAVDMGRYVLCDGLGLFAADSPESFGAASRSYLSTQVQPWLKPRLQALANSESSYLRPVAALNVRNKNQMRLYFWDGYVLTLTMTEPAQFTTQRFAFPPDNEHAEPVPWVPRMLCTGIDSSGRERLFVSYYGGVKEGYVFEMDAGRSFDGAEIPAHLVFNPLTVTSASTDKRYERFHLYGAGLGVASLEHTRAINDADAYTGTAAFRMGRETITTKLIQTQFRGVVDSPVEANDISLRFDSDTNTDGEFTLQYIELNADNRGQSRGRQGA